MQKTLFNLFKKVMLRVAVAASGVFFQFLLAKLTSVDAASVFLYLIASATACSSLASFGAFTIVRKEYHKWKTKNEVVNALIPLFILNFIGTLAITSYYLLQSSSDSEAMSFMKPVIIGAWTLLIIVNQIGREIVIAQGRVIRAELTYQISRQTILYSTFIIFVINEQSLNISLLFATAAFLFWVLISAKEWLPQKITLASFGAKAKYSPIRIVKHYYKFHFIVMLSAINKILILNSLVHIIGLESTAPAILAFNMYLSITAVIAYLSQTEGAKWSAMPSLYFSKRYSLKKLSILVALTLSLCALVICTIARLYFLSSAYNDIAIYFLGFFPIILIGSIIAGEAEINNMTGNEKINFLANFTAVSITTFTYLYATSFLYLIIGITIGKSVHAVIVMHNMKRKV